MSDEAFFDTNLPIAFVFHVDSFHHKSKEAFKSYSTVYWSDFVKKEFNNRYEEKFDNVSQFFQDFQLELEFPEKELYSFNDLTTFARRNFSGRVMEDAERSIIPFWKKYIGIESQVPFFQMRQDVDECLNDLLINTSIRKTQVLNIMQLTPQRRKSYSNIESLLKNQGVKGADRTVILDGHDFACFSSEPIDFVTFDGDCYDGACNVGILCFDSIKGKNNFKAS